MTPQEVADSFYNLGNNMQEELDIVEVQALFTLETQMKSRIHDQGIGASGNPLTNKKINKIYSDTWKEIREGRGLITNMRTHEFEGDLRRRVVVGTSGGKNVLGFLVDIDRIKVEDNEFLTEDLIYNGRTKEERDNFNLNIVEGTSEIIVKYL